MQNILKHVAPAKDVPFGGPEDKIERLPYFRGQKPHFGGKNLENFDISDTDLTWDHSRGRFFKVRPIVITLQL